MKNRIGRFHISRAVIDGAVAGNHKAAAEWSAVFSKCVIIETVHRWDSMTIEYLAYCEEFDALPEAICAPTYDVEITEREDFIGGQRIVTYDAKFRRRSP